jgi:hypothetical protein
MVTHITIGSLKNELSSKNGFTRSVVCCLSHTKLSGGWRMIGTLTSKGISQCAENVTTPHMTMPNVYSSRVVIASAWPHRPDEVRNEPEDL